MWLPVDERRLLAEYYERVRKIGEQQQFKESDLTCLLARRAEPVDMTEDMAKFKRETKSTIANSSRIELANNVLAARRLVTVQRHQSDNDVIFIALSIEGFDLGRRYNNWFDRTGLWFAHYKDHWIWLIVGALGGGTVPRIIDAIAAIVSKLRRP